MTIHLKRIILQQDRFPTSSHYPFSLPIFHQTQSLAFETPVTLFVGENGTGKSTLVEALARACNIHIWREPPGTRYQSNRYEKMLYKCLDFDWTNGMVDGAFFGSETFRNFKLILDEWAASDPGQLEYFGGKSLITQSHGQSMMAYFRSRYKVKGLYLLDEPETALSPRSQLELLEILKEHSQNGQAQFIIATHSPILLACEDALIYSFDHTPIQPIVYEQTEHYQIYKTFLRGVEEWH